MRLPLGDSNPVPFLRITQISDTAVCTGPLHRSYKGPVRQPPQLANVRPDGMHLAPVQPVLARSLISSRCAGGLAAVHSASPVRHGGRLAHIRAPRACSAAGRKVHGQFRGRGRGRRALHGVVPSFSKCPAPRGNGADDCLSAGMDVDVLDPHNFARRRASAWRACPPVA